jgi:hypothetical protein
MTQSQQNDNVTNRTNTPIAATVPCSTIGMSLYSNKRINTTDLQILNEFKNALTYKTADHLVQLHYLQYTSVGTELGYGLEDRGSRVRFPAGVTNFSLHHRVQNGSGAHPASYPMDTRGSFPVGKAAGA